MDSFESIIAMLLRREGYWTASCVKVVLTKAEKRRMGIASAPRWEIDIVAYRGSTNEMLAVECKSFLDSRGVVFRKNKFEPPKRYKLFTNQKTRRMVLRKLETQMVKSKACRPFPKVILCLAAGHIANITDRARMKSHFKRKGWQLFDEEWIESRLEDAADSGFENDVANVVSKLIHRKSTSKAKRTNS